MDIQLKKGLLEAYVLKVLVKGETYGYQLFSEINDVITISESTLYPLLKRLEIQGCLSTNYQQYSGRLRKYYAITDQGKNRLEEYQKMLNDAREIIDKIIKGE